MRREQGNAMTHDRAADRDGDKIERPFQERADPRSDNAARDRSAAWREARCVLTVRLDNMGDVLMTTPALHALKRSAEGRRITLLASPAGAAVAPLLGEVVDDVIAYDAPWVKNAAKADAERDLALVRQLAARQFDAAVVFTVYSQNPLPAALACHLAGIPLRLAHCRENPYALLTDWVRDPEPGDFVRHEAERQLALVAAIGARTDDRRMRFEVPSAARERIRALLASIRRDERRPLVVVHPGASAPSRRYPAERFGEVVRSLVETHECAVVVTGTREERELAAAVADAGHSGSDVTNLAGELDLGELGALLARADVLVSNNTGPVHIAAAVGTPVVDLYALTNPQHTPWQVPHRVLYRDVACRYCYKSVCPHGDTLCLAAVDPGEVVQAVRELVARVDADGVATLPPLSAHAPMLRETDPEEPAAQTTFGT
jgi:lipopolysaccharide heptosyltransferase II